MTRWIESSIDGDRLEFSLSKAQASHDLLVPFFSNSFIEIFHSMEA